MARDPALAADSCVYMEAVSGDGGIHDGSGVWWLSPDVELIGAMSGPDKADPGANNTVDVTFHMKAASKPDLPPGTESITIELWVGNPSLAMAPDNMASTTHIDSIGMPLSGPGTSQMHEFLWNPPSGLPARDPQSPGHKCLIARCYPDPLIPDAGNFFIPDDPHAAQHNICIVPCGGPGAAKRPAPCGLDVTTLNPDVKKAHMLNVRAVFDLNPDKWVRDVVLRRLRKTKGFARLAPAPPRSFSLRLKSSGGARTTNATRLRAGDERMPTYGVTISAKPGEVFTLAFSADLSGAALGDAYIFHLTQVGQNKAPHGGLTAVMMAV